jgi:prepilin-type N-terminal cleavage/methylation domain-containing protein
MLSSTMRLMPSRPAEEDGTNMKLSLGNQRGFTLVELIRVIVYLGVLVLLTAVLFHFIVKFW